MDGIKGKQNRHIVFVTLYSFDGGYYFGVILNGAMQLNPAGEMAAKWTVILAEEFGIKVDTFVIMPNHMHALLEINNITGEERMARALDQMMEWFMTLTTREYHSNETKHNLIPAGGSLWKREFSFHMLKSEKEAQNARKYMAENPGKWNEDAEAWGNK